MEHLEYEIEISAPAKAVWETMLGEKTYRQWVAKSWPGSHYIGRWEKGTEIKFLSKEGGTIARLEEVKPYDRVLARHVGVINADGSEDRSGKIAKGWIGTTEEYRFLEEDGKTTLTVLAETTPEWTKMFDDGWPTALQELKKLTERQPAFA
jgi:uncharacterized protein YndB with AHSA1/START domain